MCYSNATCLCFKCLNYFCDSCFKYIHEKQKYSNHQKENIDLYVPIEHKCPEHPNNELNLFCLEEKGILLFL